jgi:primosomal protein N' (replication factor Y)
VSREFVRKPDRRGRLKTRNKYAEIVLAVPAGDTYSYSIPGSMEGGIAPGMRVVIPFGKKKHHTGVVYSLHEQPVGDFEHKEILWLADEQPLAGEVQLAFWKWIAGYYLCPLGDVYKAAVPSVLRPEGESAEETIGAIRPREEKFLRLSATTRESPREKTFKLLSRAPAQKKLLEAFFERPESLRAGNQGIRQSVLMATGTASRQALQGLIGKGVLESYSDVPPRKPPDEPHTCDPNVLSGIQQEALSKIRDSFKTHETVLLHGVAASGKTEIYIHLIREQLDRGKRVLYLLPEIALTKQIVERLHAVFGNQVGVYHSKYSERQRSSLYGELLHANSQYRVVIGARSAIFLPARDLGLIIIDEEHDASFKQSEPSPRYHARDAAMVLASLAGARVLLGSSTPAIETYFNARNNKYGLVPLEERFLHREPARIEVVDLKELYRKKRMRSHFSPLLLDRMEHHLQQGRQVILFQNRRAYAPLIQCSSCAYIPTCKSCDVSLSYHHRKGMLVCHYCGYSIPLANKCPQCGNKEMVTRGFGTEKIEDELVSLFPDAETVRMDLDTTGTRKKYEQILNDFESGKVHILVGTQIITKGLDFGNVGLVAVLNADNMLFFPDFRAFERSYQLMMQVAGRSGRREERGEVIIQAYNPGHTVIRDILEGSYLDFYLRQIKERHEFNYPPYYRLISLIMKHRKKPVLDQAAMTVARELKSIPGIMVLGPQSPMVGRVRNRYLMTILLKIKRSEQVHTIRNNIREVLLKKAHRHIHIIADVDPL